MTMTDTVVTSVWREQEAPDSKREGMRIATAIAPSILFDEGVGELLETTRYSAEAEQVYSGEIVQAIAPALALWECDEGPGGSGGWMTRADQQYGLNRGLAGGGTIRTNKRAREIASTIEACGYLAIRGVPWDQDDEAMAGFAVGVHRGLVDRNVRSRIKQGVREACAGQSRVEYHVYSALAEPRAQPAVRTRSLARRMLRLPARSPETPSSDELRLSVWTTSSWECLCGFVVREESPGAMVVVRENEDRYKALQNYIWGTNPGIDNILSVERRVTSHLISKIEAITR